MEDEEPPWPHREHDDDLPATHVTWFAALRFCNALSVKEGLEPAYELHGDEAKPDAITWHRDRSSYRLPTEAEWEYAARAGTNTPYPWDGGAEKLNDHAWWEGNSQNQLHPVAQKPPNEWGLHDMIGNVLEWCWDAYRSDLDRLGRDGGASSARVLRGGSFDFWGPGYLRSACRFVFEPSARFEYFGFRCVRSSLRQPGP